MKESESRRKKNNKGGILVPAMLCALLWGSAFPSVKTGYVWLGVGDDAFSKLLFAGIRFVLAGILVLLFCAVTTRRSIVPPFRMVKGIALLGLVQTTMQYVFYYIGLSHTTGMKGAILTATGTFFAVIFSHFLFPDDKITRYKLLGCVLGFEGVILINIGGAGAGAGKDLLSFTMTGEGFMIISALAAAGGAVISKIVAQAKSADIVIITGWQLAFGGGILLIAGFAGGGHLAPTTTLGYPLMAYLAFLSAAAFTIWTYLLKNFPVGKVSVYNFMTPVFGSIMSVLILRDQKFSALSVIALILVCLGIILVNFVGLPKEWKPEPKKKAVTEKAPSGNTSQRRRKRK